MEKRSDKVFSTEAGAVAEAEKFHTVAWKARFQWRTIYLTAKTWRNAAALAYESFGGALEPLPDQRTQRDVIIDATIALRDNDPEAFKKLLLDIESMPKPREPYNPEDFMKD